MYPGLNLPEWAKLQLQLQLQTVASYFECERIIGMSLNNPHIDHTHYSIYFYDDMYGGRCGTNVTLCSNNCNFSCPCMYASGYVA